MAICNKCGANQRRPNQRWCLECHAKNMREARPKHSELTKEQRLRANCRSYANVYKNRGKLIQQPCNFCDNPESQMHHEDYTKPLEVIWLCRDCHLELHNEEYQATSKEFQ